MTTATGPKLLANPVQRLVELLASKPARRHVLGLAGLPGSGKSTLAMRLAQEVNSLTAGHPMVALGMDGFHLTRARLACFPDPVAALERRGAPWTFDPSALARQLKALREAACAPAAQAVSWPAFEHGAGEPVPDAITVGPAVRLVLVEGLYLLHRSDGWNLSGVLDECWFLEVDTEVALERLVQRHMKAWGITRSQAQARVGANDRLNAQIVLQGRARADWLVAGGA